MAHIGISGTTIIEDGDESTIRSYTPSVQEQTDEVADEAPDRSPITDSQRESLDAALAPTFQSPFGYDGDQRERVETFTPPTDWVSPVKEQRRKQAMRLPSLGAINDLDQRIAAVVRFDGAPAEVTRAATKARSAVAAAREVHGASRHPENVRYAASTEAKDATVQAIAKATSAVSALEALARDEALRESWFAGLVDGIDKDRADAAKALRAALAKYAGLRARINGAQALAVEAEMWDKSWHQSVVPEADLNRPIQAMRDALDYLDGELADDFTTGAFLTAAYDGIPPHTLARLKRAADRSDGASFARQVYTRAVSPHRNDKDAQDAISEKRLTLLTNSNPTTAELLGRED